MVYQSEVKYRELNFKHGYLCNANANTSTSSYTSMNNNTNTNLFQISSITLRPIFLRKCVDNLIYMYLSYQELCKLLHFRTVFSLFVLLRSFDHLHILSTI